jgi:hypothetical protein
MRDALLLAVALALCAASADMPQRIGTPVEIAGGHIVAQPARRGYGRLSKEGPQRRFAGGPIEAWRPMPELKAVRGHRIYGVNEDFVPHASQPIVQTAELFAKLIHPGIE